MRRKEVEISARMQALTALVTPGLRVCDVGCDHGFVSIYLVQKGIAPKVLAMDVRQGPLSQAQAHVAEWGLTDKIETRLSDGLLKMNQEEADCIICAGMGGPLMIKILQESREKVLSLKELILQPQSEISRFREYLRTNGFHIIKEDMVFEDGKYYPMMKVIPRETEDQVDYNKEVPNTAEQQVFDLFGQCLLEHRHPVLKQYLEHSRNVTEVLIKKLKEQKSERARERLPQLEEELKWICRALTYFVV